MSEPVKPWLGGPSAAAIRDAVRCVEPQLAGEVRLTRGSS